MNRFFVLPLVAIMFLIGFVSCMSDDFADSNQVAAENDAAIKQYITKQTNASSYSSSASGLNFTVLKTNPTAKLSSIGEEVTFAYKLYSLSDQLLDSAVTGKYPYFTYGLNSLLPGLQEGLSYLREGEEARLLIPSYLAYGSQAQTAFTLPANSPVRMDVKLVASRNDNEQITAYLSSTALLSSLSLTAPPTNVQQSSSGLRIIKTVTNPSGASITSGQSVTLNYVGQTFRGAQPFDKSTDGTFSFILGRNQLIPGFEEGVTLTRVGEKATILFPSSIGYGTRGVQNANGQYVILPYTPLRFDIEVLNAR